MESAESPNIALVHAYIHACNSGEYAILLNSIAPDFVHYFLSPHLPPIRGATHFVEHVDQHRRKLKAFWTVDRIIGFGSDVVSEWSCAWTTTSQKRMISRGTEWYAFHEGRITEVRAYFIPSTSESSGLCGFPYADRGYLSGADGTMA